MRRPRSHPILFALLFAPLAAAGLRAGGMDDYLYSQIRTPFFEKRGDRYVASRPGAPEGSFSAEKPKDVFRVFTVGGSIANVFMCGDWGFGPEHPTRLDRILRDAFGVKAEALNCGMGAYDSYRVLMVLKEVLGYDPDLIVVLSGNNEPYGEGMAPAHLREPARRIGGNRFLRWLRDRAGSLMGRRHAEAPSGGSPAADLRARRLENYEANLRAMARAAEKKGVPIVLATLPVNFRDMPPESPPRPSAALAAGIEHLIRGEHAAARRRLEAHAAAHPADPHGAYYLGRALEAEGSFGGARESYLRAVELDRPVRCRPSFNAVIRKVAAEEGALLADVEKAFHSRAQNGLLGSMMFIDGVHWHAERNGIAAAAVLEAVAGLAKTGKAGLGDPAKWEPARLRELGARLFSDHASFSPARRAQVHEIWTLYAVAAVLDVRTGALPWRPERDALYEKALAFFDLLLIGDPSIVRALPGGRDEIRAEISAHRWTRDRAQGFADAWPSVLAHAGEACRRRGLRAEAVRLFDAALALDPSLKPARAGREKLREGKP